MFFSSYFIVFKHKNNLNVVQLNYFYVPLNKKLIVLTQTNPELMQTFKQFLGSVELFICSFKLLAAAFGP